MESKSLLKREQKSLCYLQQHLKIVLMMTLDLKKIFEKFK